MSMGAVTLPSGLSYTYDYAAKPQGGTVRRVLRRGLYEWSESSWPASV